MAYTKSPRGRSKPKVVFCRVSEELYDNIPRPFQGYLESLIKKDLKIVDKEE